MYAILRCKSQNIYLEVKPNTYYINKLFFSHFNNIKSNPIVYTEIVTELLTKYLYHHTAKNKKRVLLVIASKKGNNKQISIMLHFTHSPEI